MSQNLTVNGVVYAFPDVGDQNWGQGVTDWATAVTGGMLQKAGGSFTLTAETDFGATYGLKAVTYKSRAASPAQSGVVRLGVSDLVCWRNNADNADLELGIDASDRLTYNGNPLVGASALTASRALASDASGVIVASAVTATELAYVSGVTSAIQTQINAKAPSASPTFSGTITTPLTASRAVVTGASNELAASAATATEVGYLSGVTGAIQTQLDAKSPIASPTFTGVVKFPDGSAAAPGLATTTSPTTGLFRDGVDRLGFSVAGTGRAYFMSDGAFLVTDTATDSAISSGTSAGSIVTGHNRFFRSVNFAHNGTVRLIGINNSNAIVVGGEPTNTPIILNGGSGHVRMDNASQINWRNAADNADIRVLDLDTSANINIGRDDNVNDIQIFKDVFIFDDAASPTQAIGLTSTGNITATGTIDGQGRLKGKGTATNDNAAAGYIGEHVVSAITSQTAFPTSGNYGDLTSISLTAGDWVVDGMIVVDADGATVTAYRMLITSTSGNSTAGANVGDNFALYTTLTSADSHTMCIPGFRVSLSGTTTYYLKYYAAYSVATPKARGRISARRLR